MLTSKFELQFKNTIEKNIEEVKKDISILEGIKKLLDGINLNTIGKTKDGKIYKSPLKAFSTVEGVTIHNDNRFKSISFYILPKDNMAEYNNIYWNVIQKADRFYNVQLFVNTEGKTTDEVINIYNNTVNEVNSYLECRKASLISYEMNKNSFINSGKAIDNIVHDIDESLLYVLYSSMENVYHISGRK